MIYQKESEHIESTQPNFLKDDVLAELKEDRLKHAGIARSLKQTVLTCPLPFTIGVFGGWGSGKSTIAKFLQQQLKSEEVAIITFDVWKYEGDPLRRFPGDTLFSPVLPVQPETPPRHKKRKKRERRVKPHSNPTTSAEQSDSPVIAWKFIITFNKDHPGTELPQEKAEFLIRLTSILNQSDFRNLPVIRVWNKLQFVTGMSKKDRQDIKEFKTVGLVKWKIWKVTKRQRMFLLINEDDHRITFMLCPRRDAYGGH